jgi:hypothetical protein
VSGFRAEDMLVGLVALAVLASIAWILRRGLREAWLPIGKGQVHRDGRPGAFFTLFGLYVAAALLMAFIGLDLLIGIRG